MTVIGITGPTGSGKTTALAALERRGFEVVDCDALYYRLLQTSAALRRDLEAAFGPVFLPDGSLDRRTLAARVFGDPEELERLNKVVYPAVYAAVEQKIRNCTRKGVAIDAINLVESGIGRLCQVTVAVTADPAVRLARIMARDGLDRRRAQARIDAQKPERWYRAHCTLVLRNEAESRGAFLAQMDRFFDTVLLFLNGGTWNMDAKAWKEKVLREKKNGYDRLAAGDREAMDAYCQGYKAFLDAGKTERECVAEGIRLAEAQGFKPYVRGMALKAGDKIYQNNRGKMLLLAVVGQKKLDQGVQITAAHIDSPRLDLKPSPLYEEGEMAYLKTHYYGGIRKYQWVTIPLELHGVVALKDGSTVKVAIGEGDEPKLVVNDLLPHLGAEQSKKTLAEGITGEQLNLLIGSEPMEGEEKDRVKLAAMKLLYEKYGFTEEDFISAELEAVSAVKATDIGLDRSLIGAYGHDDRVCGYAGLKALLDLDGVPVRTAVCVLADKEEIGSEGVSGMQSAFFETFVGDLCASQKVPLRVCLEKSFCLSTDVTAAFDPNFAEVYEKNNSAKVNYGVGLCKYTGSRGKGGCSDAGAEVVAYVRRLLDDKGVLWQMAELGKADQGGGGTVACYMANRNIDTLDAGVPVLSMHSPFETVSKLDCYMTYAACKAVYQG